MTSAQPVPDPPASCTGAVLLEEFAAYDVAVLGFSPQTLRHHMHYLSTYLGWWDTTRPEREVTSASAADIAAFLIAETERGMAPRTRKSQLGALRRFYGWLMLTDRVGGNPAMLVPGPRAPAQVIDVYTPDQIEAILAHTATLRDVRGRQRHTIVSTLRYTGARSGELRTLRTADIDLVAGRARVVGKSRQRVLLLPPPLTPVLAAFLEEVRPQLPGSPLLLANPHVLVTTPMHGVGSESLAREVELAGLGAGVEGRHYPHRWRHTYATELVRAGFDIHVVQRLMGHADIASTVGYTHLSVDDLYDRVAGHWQPPAPVASTSAPRLARQTRQTRRRTSPVETEPGLW